MEQNSIIRTKNHVIIDGKKMTKEEYFAMNKHTMDMVIIMIKESDERKTRRIRG